jgi:hypothetical protein
VPVVAELKSGLLCLSLSGEYTFDEVARAFEAGLAAAGPGRTHVLWDGSEVTTPPHPRGVERLIQLFHRCRTRLGRVAVVGRSGVMFGISRQLAQMLDSNETPVQAFGDSTAATSWLRRRDSGVHSRV